MARRAREKDVGLLRLYRCKNTPLELSKRLLKTQKGGAEES